jgi:hypothetical protein
MGIAAIPMGTRVQPVGSALGNINPMEMMRSMYEMRNMQQQWNSNIEAGQITAASPDMDTAITNMQKSPNAAWMMPTISALQDQMRTRAETTRTQIASGADAAHLIATTAPNAGTLHKMVADMGPQLGKAEQGYLGDFETAATAGITPDMTPEQQQAAFDKNIVGLRLGSGMTPDAAFQSVGTIPRQLYNVPNPMGGTTPGMAGGVPSIGQGGGGGGVGGVGFAPIAPPTATEPQLAQWKDLQTHKDSLDSQVQAGTQSMQNINEMDRLMKAFEPGSLTSLRTDAANLARSLGADAPTVQSIAGGKNDPAAVQEFTKLAYTQVMQQLQQSLPQGSRLNLMEYRDFVNANPTADMQRKAITSIFDNWRRTFVRMRMEQNSLTSFTNRYSQVPQAANMWGSYWQRQQQNKGLTDPVFRSADKKNGINAQDILNLLANPDPESRKIFDARHGSGSAAKYLDEAP